MTLLQFVVLLVAIQRLLELVYAARNTKALKARGGIEVGAGHYPLIVLVHAGWLAALLFFVPADAFVSWPLLAIFIVLQGLRVWVVTSLGPYWTTRIITVPGAPLRRRGPYRFMRHPNYAVVAGEIFVLPLAFGAWQIALLFSLLNALVLAWRIHMEESANRDRRSLSPL